MVGIAVCVCVCVWVYRVVSGRDDHNGRSPDVTQKVIFIYVRKNACACVCVQYDFRQNEWNTWHTRAHIHADTHERIGPL